MCLRLMHAGPIGNRFRRLDNPIPFEQVGRGQEGVVAGRAIWAYGPPLGALGCGSGGSLWFAFAVFVGALRLHAGPSRLCRAAAPSSQIADVRTATCEERGASHMATYPLCGLLSPGTALPTLGLPTRAPTTTSACAPTTPLSPRPSRCTTRQFLSSLASPMRPTSPLSPLTLAWVSHCCSLRVERSEVPRAARERPHHAPWDG